MRDLAYQLGRLGASGKGLPFWARGRALIFGKVDDGGGCYACFKGGRSALIASGLRIAGARDWAAYPAKYMTIKRPKISFMPATSLIPCRVQ